MSNPQPWRSTIITIRYALFYERKGACAPIASLWASLHYIVATTVRRGQDRRGATRSGWSRCARLQRIMRRYVLVDIWFAVFWRCWSCSVDIWFEVLWSSWVAPWISTPALKPSSTTLDHFVRELHPAPLLFFVELKPFGWALALGGVKLELCHIVPLYSPN